MMNAIHMQGLRRMALYWGISLTDHQLSQFEIYADQLRAANELHNLTAISNLKGIVERHFLDSLRCALSWGEAPLRMADIGSGAGFPGLPLKILRPKAQLTLVESIAKKAAFLEAIALRLHLDNVQVLATRAELLGHDPQHREQYDLVTARAVADLRVLAEYCLPLVRIGGRFLAPKGTSIESEVSAAQHSIAELGGRMLAVELVELPDLPQRTMVVVEKISPTPNRYPRRAGLPSKKPL